MYLTQKLRLISLLSALIIGTWLLSACSNDLSVDATAKAKNIQAANSGQTLTERLGVDDNAGLAIFYGADMEGSLADCGCRLHPQGGLARRMSYVTAFKDKYKDNIPALHVDVGHVFSDEIDAQQPEALRADALVMNDWMLKGFSQFRLDAINITYRDLLYSTKVMAKDKYETSSKESPMLTDLISANALPNPQQDKVSAAKPYVIREVKGQRLGSKAFKVAFIGVTEAGPTDKTGYTIQNPIEMLKKVYPEARAKADLVVVLAYTPLEVTKELIKQVPDIDVVIAGNATVAPPPPQREGKTIIVYATNQTKSLGELRLYLDGSGHIADYLNRYIVLDALIPDQTEAAKMNLEAKAAIDSTKAQMNLASVQPQAPPATNQIEVTGMPANK